MPFFLLIFQQERWYDLYYKNCTSAPIEEWNALQPYPNIYLEASWIVLGVAFEVTFSNLI